MPLACGTPTVIGAAISVSALPISICPQAMLNGRPSSASVLVSPVMACLVAVYGTEPGRGACADTEPLLMMRPPCGLLLAHDAEGSARAQERAGQIDRHDVVPGLDRQFVDQRRLEAAAGIVEEQVDAAEFLDRAVEQPVDLVGLGHVGGRRQRLGFGLAGRSDGLFEQRHAAGP